MTTTEVRELDTAAAVLDYAREQRRMADRAEANLLEAAVAWAAMHSVDSIEEAETLIEAAFGDSGMPLAGEGAPWVAEFAVTEFAAAIGLVHGCREAVRRPRPRAAAPAPAGLARGSRSGDLRPWLARRIAEKTLLLSPEAAAFVDRHVAPTAHRIGPVQLDRLVDEAIGTFMPDLAEERRLAAADGRYFTVESQQQHAYDGTVAVHGQLDLADAIALEDAIQTVAAQLKDLGSTESLDVRRSMALGELARRQLALDLSDGSVVEEGAPRPSRNHHPKPKRQIVLYVHISQDALSGAPGVARLERGNHLVTTGHVQDWCNVADQVTVKPVLDLPTRDPVEHRRVTAGPAPDLPADLATPPHTPPRSAGPAACPEPVRRTGTRTGAA